MNSLKRVIKPRFHIKYNTLLRGAEKTIELDKVLMLKAVADLGKSLQQLPLSLAEVPEEVIRKVHFRYGPAGLFQLVGLGMAHREGEFRHFFEVVSGEFSMGMLVPEAERAELVCDNDRLKASPKLARVATNVFQPSFSRKLYRAGRHHGSLVYGLGGARILVSHPFQGVDGAGYDVYNNTVDVVTSLQLRGYEGTFHFLDLMPGLDFEVKGMPGWLVWFSIIAIHSDLVIFVKEYEGEFGKAQRMEIDFTPDSVQKKIVEIPHDELRWAKKADSPEGAEQIYIGREGRMTEAEWFQMEAEHALPFIEDYTSGDFRGDRLIRIGEAGDLTEYPLDYSAYR